MQNAAKLLSRRRCRFNVFICC